MRATCTSFAFREKDSIFEYLEGEAFVKFHARRPSSVRMAFAVRPWRPMTLPKSFRMDPQLQDGYL